MTDVAEAIGEGLHAAAILGDGGVALRHGVEIMAEEDRSELPVGAEEALNGEPEVPGSLVVVGHGEVEDGVVDGAEEPGADVAVRLIPSRILGARWYCAIDVRPEAELAAQRLEVGRPSGVGSGLHRQRHGNMGLDVDGGIGLDGRGDEAIAAGRGAGRNTRETAGGSGRHRGATIGSRRRARERHMASSRGCGGARSRGDGGHGSRPGGEGAERKGKRAQGERRRLRI